MKRLAYALLLWSTLACSDAAHESPAMDASAAAPDSAPSDASTGSSDAGTNDATPTGMYTLDPGTLLFYDLPINSVRYAVSGLEPTRHVCVTLIWYIDDPSDGEYRLCGLDSMRPPQNPYAVVVPAEPVNPASLSHDSPRCDIWDYQPNATIDDVVGCAMFKTATTTVGSADLLVSLDGPLLRGEVTVRGP